MSPQVAMVKTETSNNNTVPVSRAGWGWSSVMKMPDR
jgi:hypothetical protein